MTNEMFEDPVTPSGVPYAELMGSLLLFRVISYEEHVPTQFTEPGKKSPAVRADLTVLDGSLGGEHYEDVYVFPRKLQSQLRGRVGRMVLGRLGQGEARKGQNAPWELIAATPQDKAKASASMGADAGSPAASAPSGEPPF